MYKIIGVGAGLWFCFSSIVVSGKTKQGRSLNRPNIILILCDDLGYGDLGCFGALGYRTPNIDRLAAEGMKFTNFYVSHAVCSASRAALLTGCYANRVGISDALNPNSTIGLNPEEQVIPELLKQIDYKTIAIGKWHLGHLPEFLPTSQGFDEYFGIPYSNDMWPFTYDLKRATPNVNAKLASFPELPLMHDTTRVSYFTSIEDQEQITTLYTEKAVEFIHKNKNTSFFMYLAHSMPHVPLAVSRKFKGKSELGIYGDVLMEIDWSLKEIVAALDGCGLSQNTLIIFTSDNGPWINFGDHAGSTGGFREGKGTTFEGGQRVPCIMKWPSVINPGTVCNQIASTIDILPTLVKITSARLPEKKIDGLSILPLLEGHFEENPRKYFFYYYRQNSLEAVRKDNWKLVFPHPGTTYELFAPGENGLPGSTNERYNFQGGLYDLRRDPGERYDLKMLYPKIVQELETIAESAREDLGDELRNKESQNRRKPGFHNK